MGRTTEEHELLTSPIDGVSDEEITALVESVVDGDGAALEQLLALADG